jgi:hypothetical protein
MTGTYHENQYTFVIISRQICLRMKPVSDLFVEKIKTRIFFFCNVLPTILPFMRKCGKIWCSRTDHRWQYGACTLHAECLRLKIHSHNRLYLLIFHYNNGCTNAPLCYIYVYVACLVFPDVQLVRHKCVVEEVISLCRVVFIFPCTNVSLKNHPSHISLEREFGYEFLEVGHCHWPRRSREFIQLSWRLSTKFKGNLTLSENNRVRGRTDWQEESTVS